MRQNYFDGITLNNIRSAYDYIIDIGAFTCSYNDFLQGSVSDIDICVNYRLDAPSLHQSLKRLPTFSAQSKHRYFHLIALKNKFGKLHNLGIDINTRQKAKPSLPYFKIYHKELELLSKSALFYNTYLFPNYDIKNLCRSEFTIKSYKHKKRLQKVGLPEFTTLVQYLNIPKKILLAVHDTGISSYTIKRQPRSEIIGLSPNDTLLYHFMQLAIKNGSDIDDLKHVLNQFEGSRRTRVKDKINTLYSKYLTGDISNKKTVEKNTKINSFLRRFKLID